MILGLDISTSITGVSVIDKSGEILVSEAWDMRNKRKFPTLWSKAEFVENKLREMEVHRKVIIEKIYIEQSLQAFRSGFSSAKTILTLAKFNGIISYTCVKVFGIDPEFIAAKSARKLCGLTVKRGEKGKEVVLQHLIDNEPNFNVKYTKHGNVQTYFYDMADAIMIARAGLVLWKK